MEGYKEYFNKGNVFCQKMDSILQDWSDLLDSVSTFFTHINIITIILDIITTSSLISLASS